MKKFLLTAFLTSLLANGLPAQTETGQAESVQQPASSVRVWQVQFRASDILGHEVYNGVEERIGEIDDLIVSHDDHVLQAVLSVGGFLGIGDKRVSIPYERLDIESRDDGNRVFYAASKAELEALPEYRYDEPEGTAHTLRASDIIGATVENIDGDSIGEVEDLIITEADDIPQAIMSVGGFLGIGDKRVAVGYDNLQITRKNGAIGIVFAIAKPELEALPDFQFNDERRD